MSADVKSMFSLFVYLNNYITYLVDIRNITCCDENVVRKRNTKNANDTTRDDKAP